MKPGSGKKLGLAHRARDQLLLFPVASDEDDRVAHAVEACRAGMLPEQAAEKLGWREFEVFCASLLRAGGYEVSENVVLTRPRLQIDLVARSASIALAVDCKHWSKAMGPSALGKAADAQLRRARMLRDETSSLEPIAAVILVLAEEQTRYSGGVAVVPVYAFSDFLANVDAYSQQLALC